MLALTRTPSATMPIMPQAHFPLEVENEPEIGEALLLKKTLLQPTREVSEHI